MKTLTVPITRPFLKKEEEDAAAVVIRSGWVTQGVKVAQFEEAVADYVGARYAVATSSCTTALHLALLASGIKGGDEVIVPSYTFIATANTVVYSGAKPVFADIDPGTYNLDPAGIEPAITRRTKAIIVVHQVGLPADMDAIRRLADKHKILVIEDAACALGSEYKGRKVGSLSDLTCFSFHPKKIITTGEGGMITTNKKKYAVLLARLRNHGASVSDLARHGSKKIIFERYTDIGFNYRMSDICAAIGLSQMKRIDSLLKRRRDIARTYNKGFIPLRCIDVPLSPDYATHSYQSYIIGVNSKSPLGRDKLMDELSKRGIATRRIMGIHLEPCYYLRYGKPKLPFTEKAVRQAILLPIYAQMTPEAQKYVIRSMIDLTGK